MSGLGTAHSGEVGRVLTCGSLFSGIGGFDLGLERAGHRVLWQVEADKQARSVLRRHWPGVTIYEDVRNVGGVRLEAGRERGHGATAHDGDGSGSVPDAGQMPDGGGSNGGEQRARTVLPWVDLICGGFPCQDLSVAGKRAGLDGDRSGLWFEFRRIVDELAPTWVLVENVPGLRSSDGGRDLAVILRGLAGLGYVGAWRSLDSQYFGLAQRRERVFLLACRDPRAGCPAEVLALAEGLSGHPAPSREAGARVAATVAASPPGQRNGGSDPVDGHFVLTARATGNGYWNDDGLGGLRAHPGGVAENIIAFGTTQMTSPESRSLFRPGDPCHPLAAGMHAPAIARAFNWHSVGDCRGLNPQPTTNALHAGQVPATDGTIPRRLTPRECERLQGFPDDWTRYADTGRELADGPRYRMLGNAITVNVAEWIGHRLARPHDSAVPSHTRSTSDE